LGYKINDRWYAQINGRINSFGGWQGSAEGRQHEWYPKTQYFGGGMVRYSNEKIDAYYRADYLHETLENLGQANVFANPPRALDEEYIADRWMHQLQTDVPIGKATLNSVVSYTDYQRRTRKFTKNLLTNEETLTTADGDQDTIFYKTFFFRETLNHVISGEWGSLQLGVDGTLETAGGSTLSSGDKHLNDFGFFTSAEFLFGKLKVRPGIRVTKNSTFKTTPAPSVNFNYQINPSTQLRWSYGRGFRAPSIRELYHEFINSNHNILGNPDLKPEYSHNVNFDLTKQLEKQHIEVSLGGFYNHVDNRITYFIPSAATQATTYVNLDVYKTTGANARVGYNHQNLSVTTGFSYIGQYQSLSESEKVPTFQFFPEVNNQVQYRFAKIGLQVSSFYKFNGPNKQYTLDENEEVQLSKIQGFHFLDATIAKTLFTDLSISIGARNLLDITSVNSNYSGGAHSSGGSRSVSYGRSYFFQLKYQFKN
ncbi:MAG: TonB-dependent receptor, partial [Cyclobacteriaceae bacterium]